MYYRTHPIWISWNSNKTITVLTSIVRLICFINIEHFEYFNLNQVHLRHIKYSILIYSNSFQDNKQTNESQYHTEFKHKSTIHENVKILF